MKTNRKGFTLVELIVVMAIFIIVIIVVTQSFNTVLTQASRLFRSENSNTEGVVGLEMLRHDLNVIGFGLATEASSVAYTGEAAAGVSASNGTNTNPSLNDPFNGPPRPVAALERSAAGCGAITTDKPDNTTFTLVPCSDYLALKATSLGAAPAAQRWTYLNGLTPVPVQPAADNPIAGDSVVVLNKNLSAMANSSTLVPTSTHGFYYNFGAAAFANFTGNSASVVNVYGVGNGALRMPFNRVDYFVAKHADTTKMSASCAPGTGVLYRAQVNNTNGTLTDGKLTYSPILDCVASMQVVFGWSTGVSGLIDTWTNADGSTVVGSSSAIAGFPQPLLPAGNSSASNGQINIRNNLKQIKIYILAQNGAKDSNYTSPSPILVGDATDNAGQSLTYSYDINGAGWQNYRWKLYRIFVTPKNLAVNQ